MKNRINQVTALFFIYLLIISPFSLAVDELSPDESSPLDQESQYENAFNNDPTPENFNNLPDPTAADLAKVPNPTLENFNHLSSDEQGIYLTNENLYQQEFAEQYYSDPANWGTNAQADTVFFKQQTGLRDFLQKGAIEKNAAQQYFINNFNAPYKFDQIAGDFFFDQEKGMLKNGLTNLILAEFKGDQSITGITSTTDGFEISRKIEEKEQKVSVAGAEAKTVSYDREKGSFTFQLPSGQQQFEIPADAQVTFTFDKGKVTVDGPASGLVNTKGDYAQFINHDGKLILSYDGDLDAENAEVITSRLYTDGRYSKRGNKIQAWDVGLGGKQTVVVDKNACPEAGACVGVSTQGQWDARYLSDQDKSRASTLRINLDEVASTSSFYVDPAKPQPREEEKAEQLREQARQLRKPAQPPLQGNNAEVWINKDDNSKAITVTSKGVVAVGLYDARGNSAKPLKDTFSYRGLNGLSELDAQFSARTQANVRGQAEFKNDQFIEGIATNQDGAVIKVTHDSFRPDQADVLRAECFDCAAGEAIVIQKSINIAQQTGVQGVFAGANRDRVRLTVDVDENGKIRFEPNRQDLGFLSQQILQEGQEVSIGNNLLVSVPCGELECNFKLSRDPRTAELGAAYEFVDPKNPEAAVKRIEYPLTIGKALGSEAVLVSEVNAAEVSRLTALVEEGKFNELSTLSFDKDDPGYAALKKKFLSESGLNLDAISDQKYARELQTIIETNTKAREAYQKYGIELDAFGNFKTREDAEKYQKIVNKGLGADVDELTKAKWDLSRMRVKEIEGLLAACQGTSYCSVSEKDLKAAKEEENKILRLRTANYNRWKALVVKAELDRLRKEATERNDREDKGIDATDKKELEDTKRRIDSGEKRKVDLTRTLEGQKGRVNGYRSEIRTKLEKEWLAGGGGGAIILAIDWDRYETDPNYVISLVNKHAPRDFFTNELDPELIYLRESFRADTQAAAETERKVGLLESDLKAFESQNQALIEKYRLEGKDDVAAWVALAAGKYPEVNNILSGPNLATQEGIKEVVRLGKDKDGNVVVLETIDVSVLAGQSVVSDEVAKDIAGRAVRQQRDETLDQVALLYNYGYGNEAGAMLQVIEADNPELAQKLKAADEVPEALLDSDVVKLKKARLAQTDYEKRALEQREKDLEQATHQARLKKEEEELGTGREVARAWEGLSFDDTSIPGALGTVTGAGRLAEASFGFLFDSSEKAAADALGITEVREDLDKQAFEEQERQIQQLHSLRGKLREYEQRGLPASQAFADARAGIDRGADGIVLSSSDELQISVGDEPAAALLEFDLTRSVFSEADKKLMETMDPLERYALIDQRQQEYAAERRELEFSVIARDAENSQRFNRNKLAGEAAAKYEEAVAVCRDCAGAQSVQRNLDTLNQNVLGDIIGVYIGEEAGKVAAGGLEEVGVTYTRETEETFRDMAIASLDALTVFDIAEAAVGAPLLAIDALQKLRKVSKAVDAAGTAVDAYRYASKGSRELFAAAKAAERAADTAEAAVEAKKAVDVAKAALDAEIKAGQQASKYQKIQRAINTPLGKFDRDVAKARNLEIDTIAAQTQNLNQAQRELAAARTSGDALAEGQSLVRISEAQGALDRSVQNIDELDDLLRVSNLAGPNRGVVRKGWDATFANVFGAGPGEEVLTAENDFRRAADNFAEASVNARLVGDTPEAVLSRARLDAAKEGLEVAARKLDDAYLDRKVERSKNALKVKLQQAQVSGSGDEVYDAVGADGVWKLDDLASDPAVRIEPEGTGLRFEVPEEAPPQLRVEVEEGNRLMLRIDTSDVRAEAELEEQLLEVIADSEYAAAHDVKARRLEAVGEEIPESFVSDVVEPCSLAAAAIYGLAPCVGVAEVVEEVEEIAPRVSGPRISEVQVKEIALEQTIEGPPLPVTQVEEIITPELTLKPQQIIQEKDGVVIVSEENMYFVDEQGKVSSVSLNYIDGTYTLRPKEARSLDQTLEQQLRGLAGDVREGKIAPSEASSQDKLILVINEAVNDKTYSLQVASPNFDDLLLNPSGTHQQYLSKVDDTIEGNRNLQYLHAKFSEKGTPVRYSLDVPQVNVPGAVASYSPDDETVMYKLFVDDEDLLETASTLGYQGDSVSEARQLVAQRQVQAVAGHETYHHAFRKILTPEQRARWAQYVQQIDDPAIRSAVKDLVENPVYISIAKDLPPEQAWEVVADEIFAHRNDFHAFGPSGLSAMELPASSAELNLLKELGILPTDYVLPKARTVADLQPKRYFRVQTKTKGPIGGRYVETDGSFVKYTTEEERGGLLGKVFKTKTSEANLHLDELDQSTLILEGDQVRVKVNGQKVYGKYVSEDLHNLKLLDEQGNLILLPKDQVDLNTLIKVPEGTASEVVKVVEAPSVAPQSFEREIPVGELRVDNAVNGCAISSGVIIGSAACVFPEVVEIPAAEVSGVRAVEGLPAAVPIPEEFIIDDVGSFLRRERLNTDSFQAASPDYDNILVNVHGTHQEYLDNYAMVSQENPVLSHVQQQFAAKGIPGPRLTDPTAVAHDPIALGFYHDSVIRYKRFVDDEEVLTYAGDYFGYAGTNVDEAKTIIAQQQVKRMAGYETLHHAYQNLPEVPEEWNRFARQALETDPNFQEAAQKLRKIGYKEEDIIEELFTYRTHFHAFAEPELSEFGFIASNDELKLLKEIGVLPPDYKRPTKAVHLGEGVYELEGKKYFRAADGNWKEKKEGGFFKRLFSQEKEVDDFNLREQLYIEELNVVDQGEKVRCIVGGAIVGLAGCVEEVIELSPKESFEAIAEQAPSRVSSQTQEIFNREAVQLAEKGPEELQGAFYKIYNSKTAPTIIEEGTVSHFQTAFNLQQKIASERIDVDPALIQGGWIGLSSVEELPKGNVVRYYFNSKNLDSSLAVVEKVAKELSDQKIPFKIKANPDKAAFARRTDNTVLYVDAVYREQVENFIAQLNPVLFDEEVPLFTQKVGKGVSWAEEPGNLFYKGRTPQDLERLQKYGINAPSFGSKRSVALAEVYTATDGKVGPEFDEVTREIFKKHGIDPDQPWLNLNSPLKEIPAPRESGVQVIGKVPSAEAPIPAEVLEQQAISPVNYLGNGVFEFGGKRYTYDIGTGTWKQQRTLLWDKKITDDDIIVVLDDEWSRRLEEGTLAVSDSNRACAIAGGAIYGAACQLPETAGVPEPTGVNIPEREVSFPERAPAVEQNLGKFKEGPEGFIDNSVAGQRAYDSLENGEVLRISNPEESIDNIGLVTIEGNKKYLTIINARTGIAIDKTELVPTILSQTSLEQTAVETLVVEDFVAAEGASIKRTGAKVDPSKVENNRLYLVSGGETVPLGNTFAARKEYNIFTLRGEEYLYSTDEGWTTKGFFSFGKKQVTNPQDLAHLEAARLNVPLTEFGAPRQRFYFSEYVAPEWETGAINVLDVYQHDDGHLVRSQANFYFIDEAGDIYSVRGKFAGSALSSVPEGVDKDLIIGTLNTNPRLKERFLSDVNKLEPKVIDDATKGKLYLQEIANDKAVTILAAGPDFDNIGVNVHGSHQGFVDSYNALSGIGPEVRGIEANPVLRELHTRFREKGIEELRLTHDQVSARQAAVLGTYEEVGDGVGGIRYQIFTDEKSALDQARAAYGYKGNDIEEAKKLLAQEQLKLLAGHETTHHAFAKYLDPAQRDAWVNYVRTTNDPGMRKAWDYLKSSPNYGHLDDVRLADEMLAFRYDYHIYGDATANFKFSPSQQELDLLERLGLPIRKDVAVKKSDTIFELADQEYVYNGGKQIWTTRGIGIGPLRFGRKQVTDPEIIARLDTARLNVPVGEVQSAFIETAPIAAE